MLAFKSLDIRAFRNATSCVQLTQSSSLESNVLMHSMTVNAMLVSKCLVNHAFQNATLFVLLIR
jgi:hypothetical protein